MTYIHPITALINTSIMKEVSVGIRVDGVETWKKENVVTTEPQRVLPLLLMLLKEQSKDIADVTEIEVHPGPGSYTGLRVGFTIAQALGYLLAVPINGAPADKLPPPIYE